MRDLIMKTNVFAHLQARINAIFSVSFVLFIANCVSLQGAQNDIALSDNDWKLARYYYTNLVGADKGGWIASARISAALSKYTFSIGTKNLQAHDLFGTAVFYATCNSTKQEIYDSATGFKSAHLNWDPIVTFKNSVLGCDYAGFTTYKNNQNYVEISKNWFSSALMCAIENKTGLKNEHLAHKISEKFISKYIESCTTLDDVCKKYRKRLKKEGKPSKSGLHCRILRSTGLPVARQDFSPTIAPLPLPNHTYPTHEPEQSLQQDPSNSSTKTQAAFHSTTEQEIQEPTTDYTPDKPKNSLHNAKLRSVARANQLLKVKSTTTSDQQPAPGSNDQGPSFQEESGRKKPSMRSAVRATQLASRETSTNGKPAESTKTSQDKEEDMMEEDLDDEAPRGLENQDQDIDDLNFDGQSDIQQTINTTDLNAATTTGFNTQADIDNTIDNNAKSATYFEFCRLSNANNILIPCIIAGVAVVGLIAYKVHRKYIGKNQPMEVSS